MKQINCLLVHKYGKDQCQDVFVRPDHIISVKHLPHDPFSLFGSRFCSDLIHYHIIDPALSQQKIFEFDHFNDSHLLEILYHLDEETIKQHIIPIYDLLSYFKFKLEQVSKLKIVLTATGDLVDVASHNLYTSETEYKQQLYQKFKSEHVHFVNSKLNNFLHMIPIKKHIPLTLSNDVQLILNLLDPPKHDYFILTTTGKWIARLQCVEHNETTSFLIGAIFADLFKMRELLKQYGYESLNLEGILKLRTVPNLDKHFDQMFEHYGRDWKKFIEFCDLHYDTYVKLEETNVLINKLYYLTKNLKIYSPSLRYVYGDDVDYCPKVREEIVNLMPIDKKFSRKTFFSILEKAKKDNVIKMIQLLTNVRDDLSTVLKDPLYTFLPTQNGSFTHLNKRLFIRVPYFLNDKTFVQLDSRLSHLKDKLKIKSYPEKQIVEQLLTETRYESCEELLVCLVENESFDHFLKPIIYMDGQHYNLNQVVWSLDLPNPPPSLSRKLLSQHYSNKKLRNFVKFNTTLDNIHLDIYQYFSSVFERLAQSEILHQSEYETMSYIMNLILNKKIPCDPIYLSFLKVYIWDDENFQDFNFFKGKFMKHKCGSHAHVFEPLKVFMGSVISETDLKEFLQCEECTVQAFELVCRYISKNFLIFPCHELKVIPSNKLKVLNQSSLETSFR